MSDGLGEFEDVSEILGGGVYVLLCRGRVVFVGKATRGMLHKIIAHRNLAKKPPQPWFPIRGVVFDQVLIRYVHPDRIDSVYSQLISIYSPRANEPIPWILEKSTA